jgi:hypothetical protein
MAARPQDDPDFQQAVNILLRTAPKPHKDQPKKREAPRVKPGETATPERGKRQPSRRR